MRLLVENKVLTESIDQDVAQLIAKNKNLRTELDTKIAALAEDLKTIGNEGKISVSETTNTFLAKFKKDIEALIKLCPSGKLKSNLIKVCLTEVTDAISKLAELGTIDPKVTTVLTISKNVLDILQSINADEIVTLIMQEVSASIREKIIADPDNKALIGAYNKYKDTDLKRFVYVFNNTLDFNASINTLIAEIKDLLGKKAEEKTIDWQAKLDAATKAHDLDKYKAIWDKYYKTWGKDAEKIKLLGQTLQNEIAAYGFNEKTNPFLNFLKNNPEVLAEIFSGNYTALHNAAVHQYVLTADLFGKGDLGKDNIIFSPSLYKKSATEIDKYLQLQKTILSQTTLDKIDNSITKKRYTTADQKFNKKQFIIDLFYEPGNIFAESETNGRGDTSQPLHSLQKIVSTYNLLGNGAKLSEPVTVNPSTVVEKVKANHLAPLDCMYYLANKYINGTSITWKDVTSTYPDLLYINLRDYTTKLDKIASAFENIKITPNSLLATLKELNKLRTK